MLTLAATNTIAGVAVTGSVITYSIFGMSLNAGVETYSVLAQGQLAASAGTLYTVPAATTAFIKQITLANTSGTQVLGTIVYVNGTTAGNQITGSITIPANGTAMIDDDGLAVYDQFGSRMTAILSQTATALSAASALPANTTAVTQIALDNSAKVATTAFIAAAIADFGTTNATVLQTTVNLSYGTTQPVKSGQFNITGSGWTTGKRVIVQMAGDRPNQTLLDSMDMITATGVVLNPTTIQVNWNSLSYVSNSYTFNYWQALSTASSITTKITVNRTAATAAALVQDINTSFTLNEFSKIQSITMKHSAAWTGGTVTSVVASLGTATDRSAFALNYSLSDASAVTAFADYNSFRSTTMQSGGEVVTLHLESTDGNLNTLSSTAVLDIWITTTTLQ